MEKHKRKNDTFWQVRTLPFIALWTGSYVVSWFATWYLITGFDIYSYLPNQSGMNVIVSFISLLPALLQVQLVERLVRQSMRRWMLYTLAGTILTIGLFNGVPSILRSGNDIVLFISLLVPVAMLQAIWLSRRVQSAWLWILASIVGSLLFALPLRVNSVPSPLMILAGLLYGLIQGSIMRHLLTQTKGGEKAKVDFDLADQSNREHDRIERLQTSEHLHASLPQPTADASASKHKIQ